MHGTQQVTIALDFWFYLKENSVNQSLKFLLCESFYEFVNLHWVFAKVFMSFLNKEEENKNHRKKKEEGTTTTKGQACFIGVLEAYSPTISPFLWAGCFRLAHNDLLSKKASRQVE